MEDVLTSNVFGLLKYVPAHIGLAPFLAEAVDMDGKRPLTWLAESRKWTVNYEFWPWMEREGSYGCEPDVLLRIESEESGKFWILVEAKYLSGKSSFADDALEHPHDQLAREWDNLVGIAEKSDVRPVLIYLTAGFGIPSKDIVDAKTEYEEKRSGAQSPNILWLSWRHLHAVVSRSTVDILRDLGYLMERLGLVFYRGFNSVKQIPEDAWNFVRPVIRFNWGLEETTEIAWRFVS